MQLGTNAVFGGEETVRAAGGASGLPVQLQLPNSKIHITLSAAKYIYDTKLKDKARGISPAIPMQQQIANIINGGHTVMEVTLKYIQAETRKISGTNK